MSSEMRYGWGTPDLKLEPLLEALVALTSAHGIYDILHGMINAVAPPGSQNSGYRAFL